MYEIFRIADRLILSFLTYKSNKFIPRDFDILYLHRISQRQNKIIEHNTYRMNPAHKYAFLDGISITLFSGLTFCVNK